jgi:hypothetical protein
MDMMRVHFDELQEGPSAAIDLTPFLLDFVSNQIKFLCSMQKRISYIMQNQLNQQKENSIAYGNTIPFSSW